MQFSVDGGQGRSLPSDEDCDLFVPTTLPGPDIMHTISAILSKHSAMISLFVITPDETVAHAYSNTTHAQPSCPANHLNRLYHDAARLIPDSREVSLSFGTTCVTLRPLPLNWVLAVHHQAECDPTPFGALQKAAQSLPKTDRELKDEIFSILTPDAVMGGELGAWLMPMIRLLEEVTGEPPQALFHQAVNEWIDREDPCHEGLTTFSVIIAHAIDDPDQRSIYAEKAKGILAPGERIEKGEENP